jgi:nucleoid DNA-binding protein
MSYTKNELVEMIVGKMDKTTNHVKEFEYDFLRKIDDVLANCKILIAIFQCKFSTP